MFNPSHSVRSDPAIWREDVASQLVMLAVAPASFPGAALLVERPLTAAFVADGLRHLVLDSGGIRHRLCAPIGAPGARFAILLPPLGDPLRVAACDAARRLLAGRPPSDSAAALRPSSLQRQRLALLLRVLDASFEGRTMREIGTRIVYPWLGEIDAAAWKAMSERRRVQRLAAEANALCDRDYRQLLKG